MISYGASQFQDEYIEKFCKNHAIEQIIKLDGNLITFASALSALTTLRTLARCCGVTKSHLLMTTTLANSTYEVE